VCCEILGHSKSKVRSDLSQTLYKYAALFGLAAIGEFLVFAGDCNDGTASSGARWNPWLSVPLWPPESE